MNIAVIGGGNIGTQFACVSASRGHNVRLYTSRPEIWSPILEAHNDDGTITRGEIVLASDNIADVLRGHEVIFITHPAFMLRDTASMIAPYVHEGTYIGVIPGTGGAEFAFIDCVRKGAALFGLQRVPSVARVITPGRSVRAEGYRDRLKLAAIPGGESQRLAGIMTGIFGLPCDVLPNYLNVTLTPSNPILHTTRLRTLFGGWHEGMTYPENPLFYGSWSDDSSRLLLICDNELQELCRVISLDLSGVISLRLHYESNTPEELTRKIRSIRSLHSLKSPMREQDGGFVPDFTSRYFTADFPYGLAIIEEAAGLFGFKAANISETMKWYRDVTGDESHFRLGDFGIDSPDDFLRIYTQEGLDKMQNRIIIDQTRPDQTRPDHDHPYALKSSALIACFGGEAA